MQRKFAEAAVHLREVIVETGQLAQLFDVVLEAVAQAAEVDFLQADEVEIADVGGDAGQGFALGRAGQELAVPLVGVAEVAAGVDGGLDVVAEDAHSR